VLGPTVLRLRTLLPSRRKAPRKARRRSARQPTQASTAASLHVVITAADGAKRTTSLALGPSQARAHELVIRESGSVRVQVTPSSALHLWPSFRVPKARSLEPVADLHARLAKPVPKPSAATALAHSAPTTPAPHGEPAVGLEHLLKKAHPVQSPPLTATLGLRVGSEHEDDEYEERDGTYRLIGQTGLTARFADSAAWLDLEAKATGALDTTAATEVRAGLDWAPTGKAADWYLALDVRTAHGRVAGAPLSTGHAAAKLRTGGWLLPRWRLLGQLRLDAREPLRGGHDAARFGDLPALWSTYKDTHRRMLSGLLWLRYYASPRAFVALGGGLHSNSSSRDRFVDHGYVALRAELGRPPLWTRIAAALEHRLEDRHRREAYWSPALSASVWYTVWPSRHLGCQLVATVSYHPEWEQLSFLAGPRFYLSRDRGLIDVRPSRTFAPSTAAWAQQIAGSGEDSD
jgi:hypothetical protein